MTRTEERRIDAAAKALLKGLWALENNSDDPELVIEAAKTMMHDQRTTPQGAEVMGWLRLIGHDILIEASRGSHSEVA